MTTGLIFDMDGLMVDSERLYHQAQRQIAARFGRTVPDSLLYAMMGRKPLESLALFASTLGIPAAAADLFEERNRIMRDLFRTDLQPMPGLPEILAEFFPRCSLAVATGAQQEFLDLVIDKLEIRRYFTVLQSSDGIARGKPDPEIFLKACRRLGLSPGACIVLEDAENGVMAGKRAGCQVVAVPSPDSRGQDFSAADAVVADLFAAASWIRERISI